MTAGLDGGVVLARDELHGSLADPLLEVMNFLNEVTLRYPDAISFGPGRPYEGLFEIGKISFYLESYLRYLEQELGQSPEQVRTSLFQYGRTSGQIHPLIARTLENDEGIRIDPESLVVTVGCQEAMFIVLRALFGRPDDVLLVSSPCYIGITGAARLLDIPVIPVPERESGVDLGELRRIVASLRAQGRRPRALYVIPDFSNPLGARMPVDARTELLALAGEQDLLVLEDNPYGFFDRGGPRMPTLKSLDTARRVIYLGSFAKTCFPGARVGYVVADQVVTDSDGGRVLLAEELSKIKSMVTVNTSAFSQAVIGGMLVANDCRLLELNKPAIEFYRTNLETTLDALGRHLPTGSGVRWNSPEGGFFVTVTLPFAVDNEILEVSAGEFGVIWTPMSYFYLDGGGQRQIRLSCSYLESEQIEEGVRRLAGLIERYAE
jgi:(S)-3,5-dihydroxyphenylglycine transaminase